MSDRLSDELQSTLSEGGADAAIERLGEHYRAEKRYHELFDLRLMQSRFRNGLPVDSSVDLDELPEPLRSKTEEAYVKACREVGQLLMADQKFREAWMYLKAAGERQVLVDALAQAEVTEENLEEIVELTLHEGLAPTQGLELILEHYGTCNAITTFEGVVRNQPITTQRRGAAILVRHLHRELMENVSAHIEQNEATKPSERNLAALIANREWLFEGGAYHIDTSHLSSVIRFARLLEDPDSLRLALQLTEYGRRLNSDLQYPGDEPFVDTFTSHGLLFSAALGERIEEAEAHFRGRAESVSVAEEGTAAVETLLILLARLGRFAEGLEAAAELLPAQVRLSPYAPTMLDLARQGGKVPRYIEICRKRGDWLGAAAGWIETEKTLDR